MLVLREQPTAGVVFLRLNRPRVRNALNLELRQALAAEFRELAADATVHCVVLTGSREAFAAGADIGEMAEAGTVELMQRDIHLLLRDITQFPKPLIAAVNGFALGGGCELALHADIIIAGKQASFGFPEVRLGIMPGGGGTQRLLRAVGKYRAMRWLMTGERFSAEEALTMGLVSDVVADDAVEPQALELARRLAASAPLALAQIKEVVSAGPDMPLDHALALERKGLQILFGSEDKREGFAAFIEKREPVWQGR